MKTGIELIAQERLEQIEKHGRSVRKDVLENDMLQLAHGACILATPNPTHLGNELEDMPTVWDQKLWVKMVNKPYKERLIIAGALLAAEIDRLIAEGE